MELKHLQAFVVVADELHFTRAAERLHVAQQALSTQIRQLETELGTQLFERSTRRVALTPAGEVLLPHATHILEQVKAAKVDVKRAGDGEVGHVRIAYTPTNAQELVPCIVQHVHAILPDLKLTTVAVWPQDAVRGLLDGSFDVALTRSLKIPPGITSLTVRQEDLGVIIGAGHELSRLSVIPVDALKRLTLAIWPREVSELFYDRAAAAFGVDGDRRVYEFQNFAHDGFLSDTVARMEIAAGRAFQPAFRSQYSPLPDGFMWRPVEPSVSIPNELVFREEITSHAVTRLVAAVKALARERGWLDVPQAA